MTRHAARFVPLFVLAALTPGIAHAQNPDAIAADAERLVQALNIRAGGVVAEVGAGDGALTIAIGRVVGEQGHVYSTELNRASVAKIEAAAGAAAMKHIEVLEGRTTGTNLPAQCCDAIFLRDVYHHFTEPAAMNGSLLASLKPGGMLGIIDFGPPPGSESADPARRGEDGQHGITPATLERELKAAGFEVVSTATFGMRGFLIVAKRPRQQPAGSRDSHSDQLNDSPCPRA